MKQKTYKYIGASNFEGTLLELSETIQNLIQEHGEGAEIDFYREDAEFCITRTETDVEEQHRIKRELENFNKQKEYRLQQYEELKKEFGDK